MGMEGFRLNKNPQEEANAMEFLIKLKGLSQEEFLYMIQLNSLERDLLLKEKARREQLN